MPKIAIVYRSPHHGNTKKLLDAIKAAHPEVTLVQAGEESGSLASFDVIGFASGIYMGKLHNTVRKALASMDGAGRKAFALFTCGDAAGAKYSDKCLSAIRERGFETLGFFWCKALDTFGPLKLVGGVNKGKPDAEDLANAVKFFESLTF